MISSNADVVAATNLDTLGIAAGEVTKDITVNRAVCRGLSKKLTTLCPVENMNRNF